MHVFEQTDSQLYVEVYKLVLVEDCIGDFIEEDEMKDMIAAANYSTYSNRSVNVKIDDLEMEEQDNCSSYETGRGYKSKTGWVYFINETQIGELAKECKALFDDLPENRKTVKMQNEIIDVEIMFGSYNSEKEESTDLTKRCRDILQDKLHDVGLKRVQDRIHRYVLPKTKAPNIKKQAIQKLAQLTRYWICNHYNLPDLDFKYSNRPIVQLGTIKMGRDLGMKFDDFTAIDTFQKEVWDDYRGYDMTEEQFDILIDWDLDAEQTALIEKQNAKKK